MDNNESQSRPISIQGMSNPLVSKNTLTDNQVKLAQDAFNALDADSSGTISAKEFMLAFKKKLTEKVIH